MSAEEAGRLAREAGVGRLVLTHISDELDPERSRRIAAEAFGGDGRGGVAAGRDLRACSARVPSGAMARQRNLLVNIERMRREMDEFLGDTWAAARPLARSGSGFSPRVDVYLREGPLGDEPSRSRRPSSPPTSPASPPTRSTSRSPAARWSSPASARSARRRAAPTSRSRSRPARFRRAIELGVDVEAERARATFEEGLLRVELPIRIPDRTARKVPIERPRGRTRMRAFESRGVRRRALDRDRLLRRARGGASGRGRAAGGAAGAAAARHGHLPGHADAARGRPGALDPADRRGPLRRPRPRHGRLEGPRARGARPGRSSSGSASPASSRACSRSPTGRSGSSSRAPSGSSSATSSPPSPYLVARISELPDVVEDGPELQALTRNVQRTFSEIIEQIPYLPEELQLAVTNVEDPSALAHLIAGALRIPTAEKQEILEQVDVGRPAAPPLGDPRPRARGDLARHPDPVPGPGGDRQGPARVLPARAAARDPGGAGGGGRAAGGDQRAARADRGGRPARAGAEGRRPRARAARAAARRRRPSTA